MKLPNLGVYYTPVRFKYKPKAKEEIGLKKSQILFCCCQSLSKYLPDHDDIFPRIAREAKDIKFVFFESRKRKSFYTVLTFNILLMLILSSIKFFNIGGII